MRGVATEVVRESRIGEVRHLPVGADRRLVDMTWGELRTLLLELIGRLLKGSGSERPMTPKELSKLYGCDVKRVHEWIEDGMPKVRTGDVRGVRIWPNEARDWLKENRG